MKEYIDYFKEYYTKYYGGYDYEIIDGVFNCKLHNIATWGHEFKFNLLNEEEYAHMKDHNVLDRYLEIMVLRHSEIYDARVERVRSHDYRYYQVDTEILDKKDQWMPYLSKDKLNKIVEVYGYDIAIYTENNRQTKLMVYKYDDKETCKVDTSLEYYGEIEYIDEILSKR